MNKNFVLDANTLVSGALYPDTKPSKVIDIVIRTGNLVFSKDTFSEFVDVLFRKKFDKYFIDENERWYIINKFERHSIIYNPTETITDCIDPKDNKFLELAVACQASCIVSGDPHLLDLHPFRTIPIMTPSDFVLKLEVRG